MDAARLQRYAAKLEHAQLVDVFSVKAMEGGCMAVLLWGSHAKEEANPHSDVDICVVAGDRDWHQVHRAMLRATLDDGADAQVFETLPDHLQAEVIRCHRVLWCPDEPALGEYLRPFWKRWKTQEARNTLTEDEARGLLLRIAQHKTRAVAPK